MKNIGSEKYFVTLKPGAEIKEVHLANLGEHYKNALSLVRYENNKRHEPTFHLGIRTYKSIIFSSNGKRRDMIAEVSVTLAELKELVVIAQEIIAQKPLPLDKS